MTQYPRYETVGGQASESETYSRLMEHLKLAAEASYTLGHLRKANDEELIGTGFLAIGQMLEKCCENVIKLATRKLQ